MKSDDLRLYAVTDRSWLKDESLSEQVIKAIIGGASFIQLREKNLSYDEFLKEACILQKICNGYKIPFVINDNIEIAIASNADGVHVGQSDMAAQDVRAKIGADKILGVSANSVEQALAAQKAGADYLGVGAIFSTSTKLDTNAISLETLHNICKSVTIPVVAIGGLSKENIPLLKNSGISGIAVVSAIFAEEDITIATQNLRKLSDEVSK